MMHAEFRPADQPVPSLDSRDAPTPQHALDLPRAYDVCGGVIDCDMIGGAAGPSSGELCPALAQWIVERRVVSFNWRGRTLLPVFQFDLAQMSPREGLREVIAELPDDFDDGDLADWFARDNVWLSGSTPATALLRNDLPAVLHAARADRFIAAG